MKLPGIKSVGEGSREKMSEGKLYGVSVGPGDPELMTFRAARAIREAEVIAIPSGSKEGCVAYGIALKAVA